MSTKVLYNNDNGSGLAKEITNSVTGGFQTIISAITVPAIIISIAFLVWLIINLVRRFNKLSKVKADEYKMEVKKLWWYLAGVIVLFLSIIFLITMNATNWSILNTSVSG
ncbi:Uncharacterised protein (plasmid) [Mycoplasmopsis maculosa]|uniref:Uncharacterized protein n=1 Tax=Mycoplasmopsis maculosa TaxID=114885 RepID=A0A449B3W5_9BACT|nr:hypothetical protein [Mycoplasmopsis maculosa]VEU75293.1 Uncharacterised protein [Mycoplasmopsis maculosa]VEU75831.1 Uncharacterised protein [Mycoplasmopsis maculosa]